MTLDIVLIIFAGVTILAGFLGTVIPILPGVPLSWFGLLILNFSSVEVPVFVLIITAAAAIAVSVLDNFFPLFFAKQNGGSKESLWGSTIGLIAGLFFGPIGIIAGLLCGAFVGELIHDSRDLRRAFTAAISAFKGFLLGTGIKMCICAVFAWIYIYFLLNKF